MLNIVNLILHHAFNSKAFCASHQQRVEASQTIIGVFLVVAMISIFTLFLTASAFSRQQTRLSRPFYADIEPDADLLGNSRPEPVAGVETRPYWGRYATNLLRTFGFAGDLSHFRKPENRESPNYPKWMNLSGIYG
jgi:hypothetical protein